MSTGPEAVILSKPRELSTRPEAVILSISELRELPTGPEAVSKEKTKTQVNKQNSIAILRPVAAVRVRNGS